MQAPKTPSVDGEFLTEMRALLLMRSTDAEHVRAVDALLKKQVRAAGLWHWFESKHVADEGKGEGKAEAKREGEPLDFLHVLADACGRDEKRWIEAAARYWNKAKFLELVPVKPGPEEKAAWAARMETIMSRATFYGQYVNLAICIVAARYLGRSLSQISSLVRQRASESK
jgi:hypothetical protein